MRLVFILGQHQRWMFFINYELKDVRIRNGSNVVITDDCEYRYIFHERDAWGLIPDEVRYLGGGDSQTYRLFQELEALTRVRTP